MVDPFLPRIAASDWNPENYDGRDKTQRYPPGFVHEDIMELLLDMYLLAFNSAKGQDSESASAKVNQTETRKLLTLLMTDDQALQQRLRQVVLDIKNAGSKPASLGRSVPEDRI